MPPYPIRTQKYIPTACCTVHNFIRMHAAQDQLFDEFSNEERVDDNARSTSQNPIEVDISQTQIRQMARVRDCIANELWASVGH